jgi:hypothetical protein
MKIITSVVFLLVLATALEIIGTECNYDYVRPVFVFETVSPYLNTFASYFAVALVWVSDIFKLFKEVWQFIVNFIEPLYTKVVTSFLNVVGNFYQLLVVGPLSTFFTTYADQLANAYDRLSTVLVSLMWVFGGISLVMLVMEIVGMVRGIDYIRPSTYIRIVAKKIYNEFYDIGKIYFHVCNFIASVETLLRYLNINLKPYIIKIDQASKEIIKSLNSLVFSPLKGLYNGFMGALYETPNYMEFTVVLALAVTAGVLYYYAYCN